MQSCNYTTLPKRKQESTFKKFLDTFGAFLENIHKKDREKFVFVPFRNIGSDMDKAPFEMLL